jgi:hypothetical protein
MYIAIAAVGVVALLLYALFGAQPKRFNWQESFSAEGKQPYDLSIFSALFKDFFPEKEFYTIQNLGTDTAFLNKTGSIFVYIDGRAYIDSVETDRLLEFAEKGNTVLVSAGNAHALLNRLCDQCGTAPNGKWVQTRKAKRILPYTVVAKDSTGVPIHYQQAGDQERYPWAHYDVAWCDALHLRKAGGFEAIDKDYINFLQAEVGEGKVLLHSTPFIFTNYHIIKPEVLAHVEEVLSFVAEGDIYMLDIQLDFSPPPNRPLITESPLRFILGNPSLRWAWYLLLALCLLYVLSSMRRKQRPIAVLGQPENETLNFVKVMSRFYQKEGKHKHIIGLQAKILHTHLRRRYRFGSKPMSEAFFREAAEKLQMPETQLNTFFKDLERASHNSTLTDRELIAIDQKISEFYAKCP